MKKFGLLIFAFALISGVCLANIFSIGQPVSKLFNFSISFGEKGSGNVASEYREVPDFRSLDVSGVFQVEVTVQKDYSVQVEADDNLLPLIRTEVKEGRLVIEADQKFSTHNPLKIKITAPDLETIEASGASNVVVMGLDNDAIEIRSSGASSVELSGTSEKLVANISGSSKVEAGALKAENVTVDASGASKAHVFPIGQLKAEASGASKVTYNGIPKSVEKKTSGAGSVREN